jgi:hypothetical protein
MKTALITGLMLMLCGACDQGKGLDQQEQDYTEFQNVVLPVLLRDCGFHTCHGSSERFFRVWGPGRVRLNPLTATYASPTQPEYDYSKQLAESMIDFDDPSQSLLLRKPLAVEAGGADHLGADRYGRNVYRTVNDQGYLVLTRWVVGMSHPRR